MKIDVHCYETDNGTQMEFTNALIEHFLNCGDGEEKAMEYLEEVVEYIQVYLKHHKKGSEENAVN